MDRLRDDHLDGEGLGSEDLDARIAAWRASVAAQPAVGGTDLDELETHLREQIADLLAVGLDADEAFLIAVRRLGRLDELSLEFAREHTGRTWQQLSLGHAADATSGDRGWIEALAFAVVAAVLAQAARLVASTADVAPTWVVRNASLVVLPVLAAYLVRRRRLGPRAAAITAVPFVVAVLAVNLPPFVEGGATELLVAAHLPVALWFVVAYPYLGGVLRSHERRMDLVRFTGEWGIYYVLIALGGGVLVGLTATILEPAGVDPEQLIGWVLPSGAAGAVLVAAWLVEAKQRVVENMAPVLTAVFTPLFAAMLTGAVVVYALTGAGEGFDRELLGVFDALLVVVLGLVLYGISARDPARPPTWMDRTQLLAVLAALTLDLMVLLAMLGRIGELGLTPNRVAALGLNLVLLVNLAGSAWWALRFLTGHGTFHRLERWHTGYLPVFAVWAAAVVLVLPPLFAYA